MSSKCEDCTKASREVATASPWAFLPNLVLIKVFGMLNKEDRKNASGVCQNWRESYIYPGCFSEVKFSIRKSELEKARFLSNTFGSTVKHADIVLFLCSPGECVEEFISLLKKLSKNSNLKSLIVRRPSQCPRYEKKIRSEDLAVITSLLMSVLPRITKLDIGCIKDLSLCPKTILNNINPSLVTSLGQSAILEDPERYVDDFDLKLKNITQIKASNDGIFLVGLWIVNTGYDLFYFPTRIGFKSGGHIDLCMDW